MPETRATRYVGHGRWECLHKSRMIKLANVLYPAILNLPDDDDPGTEYGPGGSVDPAPDANDERN